MMNDKPKLRRTYLIMALLSCVAYNPKTQKSVSKFCELLG